jgi:hypothetical protein
MHIAIVSVVGIVVLMMLYLMMSKKKSAGGGCGCGCSGGGGEAPSKKWTVYGTDKCGWTRKQLAYMDSKNIDYSYINCESGDCGGITSYPTLKDADGKTKVGFTEL